MLSLADPLTFVLHLVTRLLSHLAETGRDEVQHLLDAYLFSTVDATHGGIPLTTSPALAGVTHDVALAGDVLIGAVVVLMSLRSVLSRSMHTARAVKEGVPRLLLAVVLMHFCLPFMQMVIDLNNALGQVFLHAGAGGVVLPWTGPMSPGAINAIALGQNLFRALFAVALLAALVILALGYVVRYALLSVLIASAPLAALCMVLPETRAHARTWARLFMATVFMQAVQLLVLRVAMVMQLGEPTSFAQTLYSLATVWLSLKVPGALSTTAHLETKAKTLAHGLEKSAHKMIAPPHRAVAHKAAT